MALATPKELGTLVAVVLKARNLRDKHTFTKQDPFTVVELGKVKKSTEIDKRGGQHPVWDQDLHIPVPASTSKENRTLKVSCFAKESKGDDLIGMGELDITETLTTGEFDDWVKLEDNGTYRGEVYLEMTFFAAGPRPLSRRPSKMPQGERLWRPPQTPPKGSPQQKPRPIPSNTPYGTDLSTSPKRTHLVPPRSSHTPSPNSRPSPLPLLPEEPLPIPGRADPKLQPVPSILRPGNPKANPMPVQRPPAQQAPPPATSAPDPYFGRVGFPEPEVQPYLPEPNYSGTAGRGPIYPEYIPGSGGELSRHGYANEHDRLAERYGSPMPLPPGATTPPAPAPARKQPAPSAPAPAPERGPDPYLEQERAALGRARQEDADADLARQIAQTEGIDLERLRAEEADREMARKLARELNEGILESERENAGSSTRAGGMPGGW